MMAGVIPGIEVRSLTRAYGNRLAVDALSFEVCKGEIVGLLGPNGAGKTSVMRILAGFAPPTSGSVRIAGFDISEHPLEVKRRIGYLPERPPLYREMSVRSFLMFAAELKGVPSARRRSSVEKAIERCGLKEAAGRLIERLGRSYRQRVALAQALVHEPEVILLDEPVAGLDAPHVQGVGSLLRELAPSAAILLTSHSLGDVADTWRRVILISKGKLLIADTPEGLRARLCRQAKRRIRVEFAGAVDAVAKALAALPGVAALEAVRRLGTGQAPRIQCLAVCEGPGDCRNAVARCVVENRGDLLSLSEEPPPIEELVDLLAPQGVSAGTPS